jgi:hypothetical protein
MTLGTACSIFRVNLARRVSAAALPYFAVLSFVTAVANIFSAYVNLHPMVTNYEMYAVRDTSGAFALILPLDFKFVDDFEGSY